MTAAANQSDKKTKGHTHTTICIIIPSIDTVQPSFALNPHKCKLTECCIRGAFETNLGSDQTQSQFYKTKITTIKRVILLGFCCNMAGVPQSQPKNHQRSHKKSPKCKININLFSFLGIPTFGEGRGSSRLGQNPNFCRKIVLNAPLKSLENLP